MKPLDLFTKLDGVHVDATSEISAQDRQFCEALQERYERAARAFAQVTALAGQIVHAVDWPETDDIAEGWRVESLCGDVREHAEKIQEKITNNRDRYFIDAIVEYFEKEYHLKFEFELEQRNRRGEPKKLDFCASPRKNGLLRWQDIVRVLLRKAGMNGFGNAGVQRIIDNFRKHCVRNYERSPQLISRSGKNSISLQRMHMLSVNWGGGYYIQWGAGKEILDEVLSALCYYETKELALTTSYLGLQRVLMSSNPVPDFSSLQKTDETKVEGIKFYKNGRLDIKFMSQETREAFIEMFNLGHLIEEQKNLKP